MGSWRSRLAILTMLVAPLACGPLLDEQGSELVPVGSAVAYSLQDGEQSHREAPETFQIPPLAARQSLQPGRIVKLMFNLRVDGESQVERMWVVVESKDRGGYIGSLDNQPYSTDRMWPGMKVRFQPRHVINVHRVRAGDPPAS